MYRTSFALPARMGTSVPSAISFSASLVDSSAIPSPLTAAEMARKLLSKRMPWGGGAVMPLAAKEAGLSRDAMYKAFQPDGNPTLQTLTSVMNALGMKLAVQMQEVPKV